jgi:hypothetical protein
VELLEDDGPGQGLEQTGRRSELQLERPNRVHEPGQDGIGGSEMGDRGGGVILQVPDHHAILIA